MGAVACGMKPMNELASCLFQTHSIAETICGIVAIKSAVFGDLKSSGEKVFRFREHLVAYFLGTTT